jgi:cytochrome c553
VACVSPRRGGNSTITQNPKLGQHEAYIAKQLLNFRPGSQQPGDVADGQGPVRGHPHRAYLATQAPKPGAAKNKDTIDLGKHIWRGGIAAKNVPACAGCHSPNGAGIPAQYPRLAGQHQDYGGPADQLPRRARTNSVQMTSIAERLSDKEIKAVADYIAGLKRALRGRTAISKACRRRLSSSLMQVVAFRPAGRRWSPPRRPG